MDNLDFSEEEIQEQLAILGYKNIPKHRLREFKQDLDELIQHGEWRSLTSPTPIISKSQTATSEPSPPAYTKEKVRQCYFQESGDGFYLHAGQADYDKQVLTTCQNRDYGRQPARSDSYAQHSVAPKLRLPPGAPSRLQVEPDPDDTLDPPLTDSYTSTPDSQERRFIKRKVLRKHNGQSLVCDESVYSEDSDHTPQQEFHVATMYKMYDTQCEDESHDDKNSLNSSFWSDREREEEEEEEKVEIERVISEEDSTQVAAAEDFLQEASEDERPEPDDKDSLNSSFWSDGEQEEEEEEEVDAELERVISEEDSTHVAAAEDSLQEASEEEKPEPNDKRSLSSSFWSDGECEKDEEDEEDEEVEIERVISEEGSKPEDSVQEASEEEKPEPNNMSGDSLEGGHDDEDGDGDGCSSSSDSPAPSLMTSGYGTYRPEEQEGGDYRDDHTIAEFDQDSQGDLSEARDDDGEDGRSLCSFGGFDIEPTQPDYDRLADAEPEANAACSGFDDPHEESTPQKDEDQTGEEKSEDLQPASENEVRNSTLEEQHHAPVEGGSVNVEKGERCEGREEVQDHKEENHVEKEDKVKPESSSNKDIKFIDSKVDWTMYDKMCEEFEGNLRHKKDAASCLEERLAELHLSTSAQHDFETENEDVTSQSETQSSETDGISMSAFESYIRGMTRTQSDGDIRPKPKSFIRPVMSQQTIKKTDPVAKYFQYKQLWEMFKLPGEKDRRSLRWEIKERLAYQPPPPKPRRVYVPNTYVVPTEKKRSALRWEIRNDLANGLLPHKFTYRF